MINFENLIQILKYGTWDKKLEASETLVNFDNDRVLEAVLPLLQSQDDDIRDAVALTLRDLQSNKSVAPLIDALVNPINPENISTLVYALESLDCRNYFTEVFDMALSSKPDIQIGACNILQEQNFVVTKNELEYVSYLLKQSHVHTFFYKCLKKVIKQITMTTKRKKSAKIGKKRRNQKKLGKIKI